MKLSVRRLLSSLLLAASAAGKDVHVLFPSASSGPSVQDTRLSPEAARLCIAQRLGLSHYHSISQSSREADEVIQELNQCGGNRHALFDQSPSRRVAILLEMSFLEGKLRRKG